MAGSDKHVWLHKALGVTRGVLTQPSVYGTDNRCMLEYVAANPQRMRAVVAVDCHDDELIDEIRDRWHADVAVEDLNLEEIFLELHRG